MIENIIEDLKLRFSDETLSLYNLSILCPDFEKFNGPNPKAIDALVIKYNSFFMESEDCMKKALEVELDFWRAKWAKKSNVEPRSAIDLFNNCDKKVYPKVHFLVIFC